MLEENKELCRRFIDGFNKGDLNVFDEILSPDFVDLSPAPEIEPTREGWKSGATMELAAFPDFHLHLKEQIAEGDLVVNQMVATATHRGEFMGIPATGKKVTGNNVTIFRITGGKINERLTVFDALGMMMQIGAIPSPEQS